MGVLNDMTALQDEAVYCRVKGLTIGFCHGCFDIVHPGHIHHLQRASTMVDRLFISVTADQYVNKGAERPVFPDQKRAELLASIRYCDHVIVNHTPTAEFVIKTLRPNLYFKGADYIDGSDARLQAERELVERAGGRMILTDDQIFDSTSRIARLVMSTNR